MIDESPSQLANACQHPLVVSQHAWCLAHGEALLVWHSAVRSSSAPTCPLLPVGEAVHTGAVLAARLPLPLVRLAAGKQVHAGAVRHILRVLPHVPVAVAKGVAAVAVPLALPAAAVHRLQAWSAASRAIDMPEDNGLPLKYQASTAVQLQKEVLWC